jgi:type I restriction enzyme S subunit
VSWKTVALGDVCSIVNGGTPKSEVAEYWDGDLNWLTPKEMGKLLSKEIFSTERKITEKGIKNSSAKLLPINSVILSSRAPIGHLAINKSMMATNQGCKGLIPSEAVNYEYLYYFLSHSKQLLNDMGSGATFKELSGSKLAKVEIPLPSLLIQQKIVTKLEEIFVEINKAKTATEANSKNAEALFQSYLTQIFECGGEAWIIKKLRDITYKITDGSHNPPKGVEYSDFLMFSSKNISNDKITFESPRFLTKEDYELENKRTQVSLGDVLLTIVGTSGRCADVEDANLKITLQRSVSVIKPKPEINSRFLMYYFLSINKFLNERARGAAQKGIYLETLRDLDIRFPSLTEQEALVAKLDDLSFKVKGMVVGYQNKIEQLSFYKQAILKQAFNGKLVKE